VQYKVKLLPGLAIGTQVNNTASIYFDLNAPVATNTATNTFGSVVTNNKQVPEDNLALTLVPNPAKDYVIVQASETATGGTLILSDIQGREISSARLTSTDYRLNTGKLSNGLYLVRVIDLNGRIGVKKLVIQ